MSLSLYRKWRPQRWEQVISQEHIIQTLRNAVASDRVAHAMLFAGPRGTGKTTTARLVAKAVNCLEPDLAKRPCDRCEHCLAINQGRFLDLIEIDAASNTSVEDVRDLRDKINFSPNLGRFKVYIVDEVHMLSTAAFNALLKTLEEPPPHAIFVLATTEVHKIPATVLSRCQRHEFRRIPVADIVSHLKAIVTEEGLQAEEAALTLIARQATGSMRDAISLLDQMASSGQAVTLALAEKLLGTVASQAVIEVVEALVAGEAARGLEYIQRTLDAGNDPRLFARQIVDHLRQLLLAIMGSGGLIDATPETRAQIVRQAQQFSAMELVEHIRSFNQAANDARSAWQPSLPLEMAFVEAWSARQAGKGGGRTGEAPLPAATMASGSTPPPKESSIGRQVSEAAPQALQSETPPESEVSLRRINERWGQIVSLVGQRSPQISGLLNRCRPYGIKEGVLFLGFDSDFSKVRVEREENLALAQQAIAQVLGVQVHIRCFIAGQRKALPQEVEADGMVAAALRDLGGEIVDIQGEADPRGPRDL
ncbi:MAG: DNA polymerase III subunit gamma/tau [Anaerolineales bacterium]|nr:DNA polymerase III subunit gamma/tau [Anaerolineales bacterium]